MDKTEHGRLLKEAIGRKPRDEVADFVGTTPRTVTNWTSGKTMPTDEQRADLRKLLGDYDSPGDAVERALNASPLTLDRRYAVLREYHLQLRLQQAEEVG